MEQVWAIEVMRRQGEKAIEVMGYWLLAMGYWLLAIGDWLLVMGYWLLAIGYWLREPPPNDRV